jgi:hypothetical protein
VEIKKRKKRKKKMRRFIAPTVTADELNWVWSELPSGEHISELKVWAPQGSFQQVQIVGSKGTALEPLCVDKVIGSSPTSEYKSEKGFSSLHGCIAPKYAWKLFLAGVEVYDVSVHVKRKSNVQSPANVLKLLTPKGSRLTGLGIGLKRGLILAVGCAHAAFQEGELETKEPQSGNIIDVTAESLLFLTDAVVVLNLVLVVLIFVVRWFTGSRCKKV